VQRMRLTPVLPLALMYVVTVCPLLAQEYTVAILSRHVLTNDSVIQLAKAGFDELFIMERIRTSRTHFDTSVEGLVALKQAGVTEDLIRVMALQDRRTYSTPLEAAPAIGAAATTVRPAKVMVEKHWWGFRWVKVDEPVRQ
jgi:hypothetical protein